MKDPDDSSAGINVDGVQGHRHEEHVDLVARSDHEAESVWDLSSADESSCPLPEAVGNLHMIRDDGPARSIQDAVTRENSHLWRLSGLHSLNPPTRPVAQVDQTCRLVASRLVCWRKAVNWNAETGSWPRDRSFLLRSRPGFRSPPLAQSQLADAVGRRRQDGLRPHPLLSAEVGPAQAAAFLPIGEHGLDPDLPPSDSLLGVKRLDVRHCAMPHAPVVGAKHRPRFCGAAARGLEGTHRTN